VPELRAADTYITDETQEVTDDVDAFGVAFFADVAKVVARRAATGEVVSLGACRAKLRQDASRPGFDALRAARTVRFEMAAGEHGAGEGKGSGYARLSIKARQGKRKKAALLCDVRVFDLSVLRNRTWLQSARLGLVSRTPQNVDGTADRHDVLSLSLRRSSADGAMGSLAPAGRPRLLEAANASEALLRAEEAVDAILHSIEDLETHYEHEKVAVRDDVERALARLVDVRRSSALRVQALALRTRETTARAVDARLQTLEAQMDKAVERDVRKTNSRVHQTAARTAKQAVHRAYKRWRAPFAAVLAAAVVFGVRARRFYVHVAKTHML